MAKYCPMCNAYTNCTDNCASCLEEEELQTKTNDDEFYEDLLMEQHEQM
jgi:hypothetical protein